ncbi:MAG: hypothetical protein FWG77_03190 [Treponema sp.]|nr:hypothetical protein [Treponema sp.]
MAKEDKAVYAPGELGRVRSKLGDMDRDEAKRMAQKLGGEVGYERSDDQDKSRREGGNVRKDKVNVQIKGRPRRSVELQADVDEAEESSSKNKQSSQRQANPADDPAIPIKVSYWERVKMDRCAGNSEFEIKSSGQVLLSILSPFSTVTDYVSSAFINRRMNEYYKKIEVLVTSTRNMLPRNNTKRSEKLKKGAPLAHHILDVIRYWDIEKISGNLAKLQASSKGVRVSECADMLKAIYKPLFILEKLDLEVHIRGAYKVLYKVLFAENQLDVQSHQDQIRAALTAYSGVRREVHYLLYPLLMKSVSGSYLPYDALFIERKKRILAFLNATEAEQMNPANFAAQGNIEDLKDDSEKEEEVVNLDEKEKEEEISDEERERRSVVESEKKALDRGLQMLETLFPQAGWDKLSEYPDLYPYFVDLYDLRRGVVYISPRDPMPQILIFMRTLEEMFFGLRHAVFTSTPIPGSNLESVDVILGGIMNDWRYYREMCFEKEYLPRMAEYIRILEGSPGERSSNYTKKLVSELHWVKRLYLLPYYKFDSFVASPFQKKDVIQIYSQVKSLRKCLAAIATGVDRGIKAGGAEANALCDGIENPWAPYTFQVSNPVSVRLDVLLPGKQKNNASLLYFCLAVASVLDYLMNNENSWAYSSNRNSPLFRSVDDEGLIPLTGVDKRINADEVFKHVQRQKQKQKSG